MTITPLFGASLLVLCLVLPAQAQNRKDDKKPGVVDADDALKPGTIAGSIHSYSGNSLVLRTEFIRYELKQPNGGGNRELTNILRQQAELARAQARVRSARNPREAARAMQDVQRETAQLQQAMARQLGKNVQNQFKEVKETRDFSVELAADVKVRTAWTPDEFDEMGNVKKHSQEELKKLKGDPKLPGYQADITALKAGQKVTVYLAKVRDGEEDKTPDLKATTIVITEQSKLPDKKPKK